MSGPLAVYCTYCFADPGQPCRSDEWGYGRRGTRPHAARLRAAEREGHRRTEVEKASLRVLLMQMQTDRDHYSSRLAAALAAPPEGGNE